MGHLMRVTVPSMEKYGSTQTKRPQEEEGEEEEEEEAEEPTTAAGCLLTHTSNS